MIRRAFIRRVFGGVFVAALVPATMRAGTKALRRKSHADAPTPSPSLSPATELSSETPKTNPESAQLRLWKATDAPDLAMKFRLILVGKPDAEPISPVEIQVGSYQFSNYAEVPAGPAVVEISTPGQAAALLPIHLAQGSASTLLVRFRESNLNIEWMDDSPPATENGGEFDVYNLLPASGDIQIDLGNILTAHLTTIRSSLRLNAIKRAIYPIAINGIDGKGKNFRWNTEADLRQNRKVTLLICTDIYGRVRPRINPA